METFRSAAVSTFGVLCFATALCGACRALTPSSERDEPLKSLRRRNPMAAGLRVYGEGFSWVLRVTGVVGIVALFAVVLAAL
jgi:hypothetical protein